MSACCFHTIDLFYAAARCLTIAPDKHNNHLFQYVLFSQNELSQQKFVERSPGMSKFVFTKVSDYLQLCLYRSLKIG